VCVFDEMYGMELYAGYWCIMCDDDDDNDDGGSLRIDLLLTYETKQIGPTLCYDDDNDEKR